MTALKAARTYYHPDQRDRATLVSTSAETGGEYTLLEIELDAGGGNPLHRHLSYSERFTAIEGELGVIVAGTPYRLRPGDSMLVDPNVPHRFFSVSEATARFQVELRPGQIGFERAMRIGYSLAGTATNPLTDLMYVAVLLELGDMAFEGPMALLNPLFGILRAVARRRGVAQELIARYCAEE